MLTEFAEEESLHVTRAVPGEETATEQGEGQSKFSVSFKTGSMFDESREIVSKKLCGVRDAMGGEK